MLAMHRVRAPAAVFSKMQIERDADAFGTEARDPRADRVRFAYGDAADDDAARARVEQALHVASLRTPPPVCRFGTLRASCSTRASCCGEPARAPSRSTTCSHCALACAYALASESGSASNARVCAKSP
jgi:hypothetical protein